MLINYFYTYKVMLLIPMQIEEDGYLNSSQLYVDVFFSQSEFTIGENSIVWARNTVTNKTQERIISHIKMAYPSVSQIDPALVVTWSNITNAYFHNGRVCNHNNILYMT